MAGRGAFRVGRTAVAGRPSWRQQSLRCWLLRFLDFLGASVWDARISFGARAWSVAGVWHALVAGRSSARPWRPGRRVLLRSSDFSSDFSSEFFLRVFPPIFPQLTGVRAR